MAKVLNLRKTKYKKNNKKRQKRQKNGKSKVFWRWFVTVSVSLFFLISGAVFLWVASLELPSIENLYNREIAQSTKIYDRTGKILLFDLHQDIRRTYVPLSEISRHIKNATIAIEDDEFYNHKGIRPLAIVRAVFANLKTGSYSQGGSTITQQVVKNALLTRKKTISRKVKEWILAVKLDAQKSKDEILEMYLNDAPYGGPIYGVEEAARYYFGVSAKDVSLAQAAYLAALPQRPSYYSPYGPNRDKLEQRKNLVLKKMLENGFITQKEYEQAKNEQVEFTEYGDKNIKAPHFVFYIRNYLEEKYGAEALYKSGLRVITTLNYDLQKEAEKIVKEYALLNEKKFKAQNSAMVAIDPNNGEILAMVGSRDYFDEKIDGKFNVTTALRQPGSTFKPIVYSLAFEKGYTPETILFDLKTQFSLSCRPDEFKMGDGCYAPENFDGKFRGPMTIRNALAQSINIPAVKTLYLVGIKNALEHAKKMGITSLTKPANFYGFSLVLGGGEVSLLELANAYTAFANGGIVYKPKGILKIEDSSGTVLEDSMPEGKRVISSQTAAAIADILSDNTARAPAYGVNSPLFFHDRKVAAKTGTTNNFKDVWIIGFTPDVVVGAWAGNNDSTPIENKFAGYVLAPEWRELMKTAIDIVGKQRDFPKYTPITNSDKPILNGIWQVKRNGRVEVHNILHWVDKDDPTGPYPSNPESDPQYEHWEYPIREWLKQKGINTDIKNDITTSNNYQVIKDSTNHYFKISYPKKDSLIRTGDLVIVNLSYSPNLNIRRVEYFLNGVFMGSTMQAPFSISIIPTKKGINTIKAVADTANGVWVDKQDFVAK